MTVVVASWLARDERIATAADHIRALQGAVDHRERVEQRIRRRELPAITHYVKGDDAA